MKMSVEKAQTLAQKTRCVRTQSVPSLVPVSLVTSGVTVWMSMSVRTALTTAMTTHTVQTPLVPTAALVILVTMEM
ncbi:hypothetical protein Bbelb_242220, partial [Branchiostoma belcheri]